MPDYKVNPEELRQFIRELRQQKKLTQEEVASHSQLNEKHYQDLESGRKPFNPTLETLNALATTFEIQITEMLNPKAKKDQ